MNTIQWAIILLYGIHDNTVNSEVKKARPYGEENDRLSRMCIEVRNFDSGQKRTEARVLKLQGRHQPKRDCYAAAFPPSLYLEVQTMHGTYLQ